MRGLAIPFVAAALGSFVACWDLGGAPLEHWDEGHHAKVALDMARSGEWLVYAPDGEVERANLKPPLMFYALVASFGLLGPTELAARLLPAASFVVLLTATAGFARRVLSPSAAVAAVALAATSRPFLFEHCARDGVGGILALVLARGRALDPAAPRAGASSGSTAPTSCRRCAAT